MQTLGFKSQPCWQQPQGRHLSEPHLYILEWELHLSHLPFQGWQGAQKIEGLWQMPEVCSKESQPWPQCMA